MATDAPVLHARYAFDTLGYRRFEWKCNAPTSRRGARRAGSGSAFEGIFRSHMVIKGESRTRHGSRWSTPTGRASGSGFERWLAAENFDPAGRQKQRLAEFVPGGPVFHPRKISKRHLKGGGKS